MTDLVCTKDVGAVAADTTVKVRFLLDLRNEDQVRERADRVSTPGDPLYGKFLSQSEIDELTNPLPADVERVAETLRGAVADDGGARVSTTPTAVVLEGPPAVVGRVLGVELRRHVRPQSPPESDTHCVRAASGKPRIPAAIAADVHVLDGVFPAAA